MCLRHSGGMRRLLAVLFILGWAVPVRAQPSFDYYLLSLSVEPSFCAGSARDAGKPECRRLTAASFRETPLTLHGLWPNRARVGARQQPQDCDGPAFQLSSATEAALQHVMPGGTGLARYEWRKHGTCSGLEPDRYFAAAAGLAQQANATIGPIVLASGGSVRLADVQQRLAATDPALAAAVILDCRFARGGGGALLEEVRLTLGRDLRPIPAASVGLGQNSGCPAGEGRIPLPPG